MRPRITISVSKDGEFELWLNPGGRDLLVRELTGLTERNDHFHLGPDESSEVRVSTRAYKDGDQVFAYGKVLFRTDAWDLEYFPHVMSPAH